MFRYSRWDGSQQVFPFDADQLMEALSDDLINDGNLRAALERLLRMGHQGQDFNFEGLQKLLERLRAQKQQELRRHDVNSIMDEIKKRLDAIVQAEREGIQRRLDEARRGQQPGEQAAESGSQPEGDAGAQGQQAVAGQQRQAGRSPQGRQPQQGGQGAPDGGQPQRGDPDLYRMLEQLAQRKQEQLDQLPPSVPGQIKALSEYEFMDARAREQFQELLAMLQQQVMESFFKGMQQSLQSMTPEDMQAMRDMINDLNKMLQDRMEGREPDFNDFMRKHGQFFPGVNSLDELIESLQRRRAQMQSLLSSMSREQREQLRSLIESLMGDQAMQDAMAQLASNLERLFPSDQLARRYPFRGDEPLSLAEAMAMMERLQQMDDLEHQIQAARDLPNVENLDSEQVGELLGPEAQAQVEQLKQLARMLEEAGYAQRLGNRWELTPRGTRKIGQKALQDIFGQLKKDGFGRHPVRRLGAGGDRADDQKRYEFGDPFLLDAQRTLFNAIEREGRGAPVRIQPPDFEVYRTELLTQSSTVLMLDMSRSMILRQCFQAAKRVALALQSLIRSQFPKDDLYVVTFSYLAREIKLDELPMVTWDEDEYGTNMQHGFMLSRQLLARRKTQNKQIIMITDGEPTAHIEPGRSRPMFNYPPTYRTIQETLREVTRCTREQIVINTFMLERGYYLADFVNHMTKINKGRAFYTSPDRLGEYILVDYVNQKRRSKRIA